MTQLLVRRIFLREVPASTLRATALISLLVVAGSTLMSFPLWIVALIGLMPWFPLIYSEVIWQYRHYGLYALLSALTLLQLGHVGEHVTQLLQLFFTNGNLAHSKGVFGALNIEVVHVIWTVGIWLGIAMLLGKFSENRWLWVAFIVASVHAVEHLFLFSVYAFDHSYYLAGGINGILGKGGLLSFVLDRPYLHFGYNLIEVIPLVLAYWDQTQKIYEAAWPLSSPTTTRNPQVANL